MLQIQEPRWEEIMLTENLIGLYNDKKSHKNSDPKLRVTLSRKPKAQQYSVSCDRRRMLQKLHVFAPVLS